MTWNPDEAFKRVSDGLRRMLGEGWTEESPGQFSRSYPETESFVDVHAMMPLDRSRVCCTVNAFDRRLKRGVVHRDLDLSGAVISAKTLGSLAEQGLLREEIEKGPSAPNYVP